jgi:hypothetical protein
VRLRAGGEPLRRTTLPLIAASYHINASGIELREEFYYHYNIQGLIQDEK